MKIIHDNSGEYQDVINSYYNLEQISDNSKETVLFQGYTTSINEDLKKQYEHFKNRIYLNLESPCAFTSTSSFVEEQKYFTHTYTICPYTLQWLKNIIGIKGQPIAFPYSKKCFENLNLENKDVAGMYMGAILSLDHEMILNILSKRTYFASSLLLYHPKLTHYGLTSDEKWKLLARVKSNVIMNLCPLEDKHKTSIMAYVDYDKNEAFKMLEYNAMPQFKPRVIESMVCKAVCLVRKDPWNVIEKWFTPNEDFLYWNSFEELDFLLDEVDKNYEKYLPIVNSAAKKVENFEIKNIIKLIKDEVNE